MTRAIAVTAVLLLAASLAWPLAAQSPSEAGVLDVRIEGLRNTDGQVGCTLWNAAVGFPNDVPRALQSFWMPLRTRSATCRYTNLAAGTYAAGVMHDEDGNSRMNTNIFGVPREGWGVSNNAGPRPFGPPTFQSASFAFDGTALRLVVRMRY